MKQKRLLTLITAFTLCITGFLYSGSTAPRQAVSEPQQIFAAKKTAHSYKLSKKQLSSFHSLIADLESIDLKIMPSKDNSCYISYNLYCYNSANPLTYQVKDGTLHLEENHVQWALYRYKKNGNTMAKSYTKATIYVPSKTLEKLELKSSDDGNIAIKKLSCKNGSISTNYGDVSITETTADEKLRITTADGNIALSKSNISKSLTLNTSYGDISADSLTVPGDVNIVTADGNVTLYHTDLPGSLHIKTRYGDIGTNHVTIADTAELNTADGNVTLYHTDLLGSLQVKTNYGDVNAYNLSLSGNAKINTKNGNLNLKMNDKSLKNLAIAMTTENGELSVPKSAGGRKKHYKEDGYRYEKSSSTGNARLDVTTKNGDIYLR